MELENAAPFLPRLFFSTLEPFLDQYGILVAQILGIPHTEDIEAFLGIDVEGKPADLRMFWAHVPQLQSSVKYLAGAALKCSEIDGCLTVVEISQISCECPFYIQSEACCQHIAVLLMLLAMQGPSEVVACLPSTWNGDIKYVTFQLRKTVSAQGSASSPQMSATNLCNGRAEAPVLRDGHAEAPVLRDGHADAPVLRDGHADAPVLRDGHADAPASRGATLRPMRAEVLRDGGNAKASRLEAMRSRLRFDHIDTEKLVALIHSQVRLSPEEFKCAVLR